MGVRGLATFIDRHEAKCFNKYRLHDTLLVIDGNNLCAQIYKYHTKTNDIFGGDYDVFAASIKLFFTRLEQCNITPIVILDGGYEKRKCKTVYERMRNKVKQIKQLGCYDTIFPLFLRELFKDILIELHLRLLRCDYEADFEIACLAKKLNCPVLSLDSDFFIFDVMYIPYSKLDNYISHIVGRTRLICYIDCKIYTVKNFLECFSGFKKNNLALLATLLGNDYIKQNVFKKFFDHIRLKTKGTSDQGMTINNLINWLKYETFDSAVKKVLDRMKKKHRRVVAQDIDRVIKMYADADSELLQYLDLGVGTGGEEGSAGYFPSAASYVSDSEQYEGEDESTDPSGDEYRMFGPHLNASDIYRLPIVGTTWFEKNFRFGNFPSWFMDILTLRLYCYSPQVADISNEYTIQIQQPILLATCKILLQKSCKYIRYLSHNDHGHIRTYNLTLPDLDVPKLEELDSLSEERGVDIMFRILNFNKEDYRCIVQYPAEWQLYIVALLYWCRNSIKPKANICHLSALLICLMNLTIVDERIGAFRVKAILNRYVGTKLKPAEQQPPSTDKLDSVHLSNLLNTVTKQDCIVFIQTFISYFLLGENINSDNQLYSVSVVDAFAQFQTCLLSIKHLNILLNCPMKDFNIASFYNGTFLYNLYKNLERRSDVISYITGLFMKSPLMLYIFIRMLNMTNFFLEGVIEAPGPKQRRRKRRKKQKTLENASVTDSSSEEENVFDANNKFSILALHS